MNNGWNTERVIAVTRIACTMAAALAAGFGLALDADALYTGCAALLATVCYVWSWWSNNNMTKAAQEAQKVPWTALRHQSTWERNTVRGSKTRSRSTKPRRQLTMTTARDLLSIAASQIGVKENPANSNKVKYAEWYG